MKDLSRNIGTKALVIMLVMMAMLTASSCRKAEKNELESTANGSTLEEIRQRGKLQVIADDNFTSYFLYRGSPKGFNYELLRAFADHLGVQLSIAVSGELGKSYEMLDRGEVDMLAVDLPVIADQSHMLYHTDPLYQANAVLVQRSSSGFAGEKVLVRDLSELAGRTVYVEKGSPFIQMLTMLSMQSDEGIRVVEHGEYKPEQLMAAVAKGEIDYTIAYEPFAGMIRRYHPGLDIQTVVGPQQNLVWMVNREGEDLLAAFNQWLGQYKKAKKFSVLYEKYFVGARTVSVIGSDFYSVRGGKISPYDGAIRKYSRMINWDWRLLAALIYKESKFQPQAQAWSGAYGLMQLMPDLTEQYGLDSLSAPEKHIEAGVKYIAGLEKQFLPLVPDHDERVKFVLAAYNVGLGHVLDARRLAEKYGRNNTIWTHHVDTFLLRKSQPAYYRDPQAYYGYCRGEEPYAFVRDVMETYQLYRNAIRN
ncbi:MAG TPA: transporter substrate-binding domain-containing protein [Bacteroidales bacterium]|nr:transporter substrate-binding domain-containing protein [Bacteroidales bacterium]HSA42224.1 transporter substrate-binding domain-containing protein [Bacteroidales bacterium]